MVGMPVMIDRADLDHVAVATEDQQPAWLRYAGELGGQYDGGGPSPGFWAGQVAYANGMRVEVLEPANVEQNDFLRRFLDRNGPGPHHLTFKVPDIRQALAAAEQAGYRPVSVDLSNPWWQEAFLHPKDAPGVVVQLAHSAENAEGGEAGDGEGGEGDGWGGSPPQPMPPSRTPEPATLTYVGHAVASLDDGRRLFADLLGGRETASGEDEAARWIELGWPGPGRVRLLEPRSSGSPLAAWLEGRRGRVHHIAFTVSEPDELAGATPLADGRYEVPPEANLGVRLLLTDVSSAAARG